LQVELHDDIRVVERSALPHNLVRAELADERLVQHGCAFERTQ
jgi:hypothetical protein